MFRRPRRDAAAGVSTLQAPCPSSVLYGLWSTYAAPNYNTTPNVQTSSQRQRCGAQRSDHSPVIIQRLPIHRKRARVPNFSEKAKPARDHSYPQHESPASFIRTATTYAATGHVRHPRAFSNNIQPHRPGPRCGLREREAEKESIDRRGATCYGSVRRYRHSSGTEMFPTVPEIPSSLYAEIVHSTPTRLI